MSLLTLLNRRNQNRGTSSLATSSPKTSSVALSYFLNTQSKFAQIIVLEYTKEMLQNQSHLVYHIVTKAFLGLRLSSGTVGPYLPASNW